LVIIYRHPLIYWYRILINLYDTWRVKASQKEISFIAIENSMSRKDRWIGNNNIIVRTAANEHLGLINEVTSIY